MDSNSGPERLPVPLWLTMSPCVLCLVALTFKSSLARKAMFVPIIGIVLLITNTGMSIEDYLLAGTMIAYLFMIFDFLVLTDAHLELRLADQAAPSAGSLPFFERAKWALRLLTSPRLIGWVNEPKNGCIPPRPTETSRTRFAVKQIIYITFHLLTMKILSITMTWHLSRNGLDLAGMGWGWRLMDTLQYGAIASTALSFTHRTWVLVLLCTGRWMPSDFPPMLASPGDAYTLRRFWGRTYHQMLRRRLTSHAIFVTDKLFHLPREAKLTRRYTQLYVVFFVSGAIHHWGEYIAIHTLRGGSLRFFLSQALAIHCEDIVIYAAGRMGLKQSMTWQIIGYIWVWHWFTWCVPSSLDPLVRLGMFKQLGVNVEV